MTLVGGLLAVGTLAVAAYGMVLWMRLYEVRRHAAFEALAARRGWSLSLSGRTLGRPATLRLTARSGPGWQAEARLSSATGDSGPQRRITEWSCDEPRWTEGTLIIGPAIPEGATAIAAQVLTHLDGPQGRRMLQRLTGGRLGFEAAGLRPIDGPEALTVFATADPRRRVDLADVAKLFDAWQPSRPGDDGQPILILSPGGLRLRLRHDTRTADRMEAFIDLALASARTLG